MPAEPTTLDLEFLPTYRFQVDVGGMNAVGIFTECKLPDIEWDIHEQKEGGINDFVHQLPGQRKAAKVSLKYGLTKKLYLMDWYSKMMKEDFKDLRKTVTITLLDATSEHKPLLRWNLFKAFPTKITWPELKTSDNVIAIQSLDMACSKVEFEANPK